MLLVSFFENVSQIKFQPKNEFLYLTRQMLAGELMLWKPGLPVRIDGLIAGLLFFFLFFNHLNPQLGTGVSVSLKWSNSHAVSQQLCY